MDKNIKYKIGIFFLILAIISPLFTVFVPFLEISKNYKLALSGFLLAGAPEIFLVLAGVFAGKELVIGVKNKIKSILKSHLQIPKKLTI